MLRQATSPKHCDKIQQGSFHSFSFKSQHFSPSNCEELSRMELRKKKSLKKWKDSDQKANEKNRHTLKYSKSVDFLDQRSCKDLKEKTNLLKNEIYSQRTIKGLLETKSKKESTKCTSNFTSQRILTI